MKRSARRPVSQPRPTELVKLLALLAALASTAATAGDIQRRPGGHGGVPPPTIGMPKFAGPRIQIALLIDTSSSMDGLIDQARTQMWSIVNQMGQAKRDGQRPRLELALYEYGNDGLSAESGFIRRITPFTSNLDMVSESLFALRTNGGSEFAGQVIRTATRGLEWSQDARDLKLIYIAGNEEFTQGKVPWRSAIQEAVGKGITVNTLHCGGEDALWKQGAVAGGGIYVGIDHNAVAVNTVAPQDAEIEKLGAKLNDTYLGYGARAPEAAKRQAAQDTNAANAAPGTMVQRSLSKASAQYDNSDWDLVDAVKDGKVKLDAVKKEELPKELQELSTEERTAVVSRKKAEREQLQQRISELKVAREQHLAQEKKAAAEAAPATLESAVTSSARQQAEGKAFTF